MSVVLNNASLDRTADKSDQQSGGPALALPVRDAAIFRLGNETFASLESFSQAIRIPPDDAMRGQIAMMPRAEVKNLMRSESAQLRNTSVIYWEGKEFASRSAEHKTLMELAIAADRAARGIVFKEPLANIVSFNPKFEACSNFAHTPLEMGGRRFESVEAFVHFIKFPENDPRRDGIPDLFGSSARRAGSEIGKEIKQKLLAGDGVFVYWQGEKFRYRSPEHENLIAEAIKSKFAKSPEAREQLLASGNLRIIHNTGRKESAFTSLPAEAFCRILTEIRTDLQAERITSL